MKKFYTDVSTGPAVGGGHVVLLDGRPIRTPEKALMAAPNQLLATTIAKEWQDQTDTVVTSTMPLTQMLTTTIDRASQREAMATAVMAYLNSDLICYPADEPEGLRQEQEKLWAPWLQWFEKRFGVSLLTTYSLSRLDQPDAAHALLSTYIKELDAHSFTVLQIAVGVSGSVVLGVAFLEGAISAPEVWRCALCEELYYERVHDLEKHGLDPIEQKRRDSMLRDLETARYYLRLINTAS
ncbi:MAG: ATP12 chaperone family protein [Proteobacteria bacterium]|nr:ATP12 chaperone family protein [Pseudomonadota bacterium]